MLSCREKILLMEGPVIVLLGTVDGAGSLSAQLVPTAKGRNKADEIMALCIQRFPH